ncbi:DUF4129 domain-containing protein [Ruegeria meonggei]|uniref:DUF4129 domain-containing protein n=1 Tax=Ruegeria meonggei TaxID=1446476 RepID=UPI00366DD41D
MRCVVVLIISFSACVASGAIAQEGVIDTPELGASGQAYMDAVRYGRIDTDAVYFDPTRPAPPLDTEFTPTPERSDQDRSWGFSGDAQWIIGVISLIVIIFLVTFTYFTARGTSVSFGKRIENTARNSQRGSSEDGTEAEDNADLNTLLNLPDRQMALIGLAQLVLTRCLNANGVLFKRSWTHREALRKLPQTLSYIQDLRALVLDSERVHFGGRSISEGDFASHVARIRPILREVGP